MTQAGQKEISLSQALRFRRKSIVLVIISIFLLFGVVILSTTNARMTIGVLAALTLPIVLGGSSLIVTINTRHTSIADRIRSLADRHYAIASKINPEPDAVLNEVKSQLALFARRFSFTLISLSLAYIAIVLQTLAITFLVFDNVIETAIKSVPPMPDSSLEFRLVACSKLCTQTSVGAITSLTLALAFACLDTVWSIFTLHHALSASGEDVARKRDVSDQINQVNISLIPLFTKRYHELIDEERVQNIDGFALKYFRFQKEQYRYATWNLFPRRVFIYWMQLRYDDAKNGTHIGNSDCTIHELWERAKLTDDFKHKENDFVVLMNEVLKAKSIGDVSSIVEKALK